MGNFHIGQKIVCVDDAPRMKSKIPANRLIKNGAVYVVRGFGKCPYKPWRSRGSAVWLEGIFRTGDPNWPDFPFEANRFLPVIERKTNISIFEEMLSPNRRALEPTLTEQVSQQASPSHESNLA